MLASSQVCVRERLRAPFNYRNGILLVPLTATRHGSAADDNNECDKYRGQTFAHARIVVRAELSAQTKTEEKYITGRHRKPLEKNVNKIMRW